MTTQYRCLHCQATADDTTGCPSCGAPPDPLGVEISQLHAQLAALDHREAALRHEFAAIDRQRRDLRRRLTACWAQVSWRTTARPQVRRGAPVTASATEATPGAATTGGPATGQETSTRSVQTILLALGGLLLGVALVVFTAVAWATFGLAGRATILATVTVIGLVVPVLLRRRELTATAETIAVLGLLLVLLDGYAMWAVNLAGVQRLSAEGYAAAVFGLAAVAAAAYQPVSQLRGPWFVALLAAQPVLPLLAAAVEPVLGQYDAAFLGYATAFAASAAADLAVALRLGRGATSYRYGLRVTSLILFGSAAVLSALTCVADMITTESAGAAAASGAVLVAVAGLGVAATRGAHPAVREPSTGATVVALLLAVSRPAAIAFPGYGLLTAAVTIVLIWGAIRFATSAPPSSQPADAQQQVSTVTCRFAGPLVASWGLAGLVALPAVLSVLSGAVEVLDAASPIWHADLTRWRVSVTLSGDGWQPLLVLTVLSVGAWLLATGPQPDGHAGGVIGRRFGHHAAIVTLALVVLGAPAGLGLTWWSPIALAVPVGLGLVAYAVYPADPRGVSRTYVRAATGTTLLWYAVGAALVRPGSTAAVLGMLSVGGFGVAALAARARSVPATHAGERGDAGGQASTHRPEVPHHAWVIGGLATVAALAVLPAMTGALGTALRWPQVVVVPTMTCGAAVALGVAALLRLAGSTYIRYTVVGVGLATATCSVTALATDQPTGLYAAVSALIGLAAGMLHLPHRRTAGIGNVVAAGVPFLVAVASVVSTMASPFQAYLWTSATWQGAGTGTRAMLAPHPLVYPGTWDPLTVALLTVATGLAVYGLAGRHWVPAAVLPGTAATLLVTPIGYDWPWPSLPVIALGIATACGLAAGVTRPARTPAASAPTAADGTTSAHPGMTPVRAARTAAAVVWPVAGSIGLANCLATSAATLLGLGVASVAGLVVALLGRTRVARITGWSVAASATALLVNAAGLVVDLGAAHRPYGVIGVAVLLLAAAAALPDATRRPESRAVEVLSYLVAGFAVVLALPSLTTVAVLFAGYGAMLGLSALRLGRWRLTFGATSCELIAWWMFLHTHGVGVVEAYTVPFAVAALLGGVLTARHQPQLTSWRAYGVALVAGFLPSIAVMVSGDDPPPRRLLLGTAAFVTVLVGAVRRRQAPVVVGGVVLVLLALRELAGLWELLPRWVPLAAAGLLLLLLGATYEQRRRDVRRLRQLLARMS